MTTAPRNIHIVSNTGINRGTSGRFLKQDDAAAGGPHVHVRNNLYLAPSLDTSDADTEMIAVNHMDDFAEIDDNV